MAWRYSVNLKAVKRVKPIETHLFLSSFITFVQKVWKNSLEIVMKYFLTFLLLGLLSTRSLAQISQYEVFFAQYQNELVIRKWKEAGGIKYLVVNPENLKTHILNNIEVQPVTWNNVSNLFEKTPYIHDWQFEKHRDYELQDAGITKADSTLQGFSLTIDLCPSSKPLTRSFFQNVVKSFEVSERPVPLTITITGIWMQKHQDDLNWLKQQEKVGNLRITWVNHSYTHRYDPKLPLTNNFLLEHGTNILSEVLLNEQAMLSNGLVPSIYFRFPGLVSDKGIFDEVLALGLLPLGSDAWLAKGEAIKNGSVVLVHANGNEPLGLALFQKMLRKNEGNIKSKKWLLWDISNLLSKE